MYDSYFQMQPRYARFLRTYAKKYCTETHVSAFLTYLPFSLFLVPGLVVFIEKGFIAYYNSDVKLEQFYSALIKGTLDREDVANLEVENIQSSHEIQQAFRNSSKCYDSYLIRAVLGQFGDFFIEDSI